MFWTFAFSGVYLGTLCGVELILRWYRHGIGHPHLPTLAGLQPAQHPAVAQGIQAISKLHHAPRHNLYMRVRAGDALNRIPKTEARIDSHPNLLFVALREELFQAQVCQGLADRLYRAEVCLQVVYGASPR